MSMLEKILDPHDLQQLNAADLKILCAELRENILRVVSERGGHLSSNLGTVELTVAMLRVFDLPRDRIVWDVGHQSYAYKLLTGRQKEFESLRQFGGCCGFPVRGESIYDVCNAGHAGVAISTALGMCQAQLADPSARVIAVVGDGAIGSGVALEGLNQVREHGKNLIIILNDNKMAISENVGAISRSLNRILTSYRYCWIKNIAKSIVCILPKSKAINRLIGKLEDAAKRMLLPGGVGLNEFARHYPERFYDVGMAESHAVSFASGLAASGKKVLCAIYAAGAEAVRAVKIARKLKDEHALQVKVVNVRFLKPFDCPSLKADLLKMPVFTLEDHAAATGLGSIAAGVAAEVAGQHRCCLHSFGLPNDRFIACGSVEKLREDAGLDEDSIVREIVRRIRLFQQ